MKTMRWIFVVLLCVFAWTCPKYGLNEFTFHKDTVQQKNLTLCDSIIEKIFIGIAYVEDFGKGTDPKRFTPEAKAAIYHCGAAYTTGYGSTVYPEGKRVKKNDKKISKAYAKECAFAHLRKFVFPFIYRYVDVELSEEEAIGVCMFIYNVGGENFSGHRMTGEKFAEASEFLKAINQKQEVEACARKMTGFRSSGGKRAVGLLKRHWVQAAIFCGHLKVESLLKLKPANFYNIKDLSMLFANSNGDADDFYTYKHDSKTIDWFLNGNVSVEKSTYKILDVETQQLFAAAF